MLLYTRLPALPSGELVPPERHEKMRRAAPLFFATTAPRLFDMTTICYAIIFVDDSLSRSHNVSISRHRYADTSISAGIFQRRC